MGKPDFKEWGKTLRKYLPHWSYVVIAVSAMIALILVDLLVMNYRIERYTIPKQSDASDIWVLIGSDSRFDAPDKPEFISSNQVFSERADLIFLIKKEKDKITVLSLPRDIDVKDQGHSSRLTLGFMNGAAGFSDLLCKNFSVPVNHLVTMTISGFIDVVDTLGGLEIDVPFKFTDRYTGSNFNAGKQKVDGRDALKLVRARHQKVYQNGQWKDLDNNSGSLSRIDMSKQVMVQFMRALKQTRNPITLQRLAWNTSGHIRLDTDTELTDFYQFKGSKIDFHTLDTKVTSDDGLHREVTETGWKQLKDLNFTGKCTAKTVKSESVSTTS